MKKLILLSILVLGLVALVNCGDESTIDEADDVNVVFNFPVLPTNEPVVDPVVDDEGSSCDSEESDEDSDSKEKKDKKEKKEKEEHEEHERD